MFFHFNMNITRAVIIALEVLQATTLLEQVRTHITRDVEVFRAVNATLAMSLVVDTLPLYTRHLIAHGRQTHMQIGNAEMLACLLSHVQVWSGIKPGETILVLEEDARIDHVSALRLEALAADLEGVKWDFVRVSSGQLIDTGGVEHIGAVAARCADGHACWSWGTRGYVIQFEGARQLLKVADPAIVQVDALISLAAAYTPFQLYWSTLEIAYPTTWRASTVFDGCIIRCFLDEWVLFLVACCVCVAVFRNHRIWSPFVKRASW